MDCLDNSVRSLEEGAYMVGLVIGGHGHLADALLESATLILGTPPEVVTVALEPSQSLEELHSCMGEAIAQAEQGDGVLVLLDLYGGTPSNATALHFQADHIEAVTGVNLPMLLEVLLGRAERDLKTLTTFAEEIGRQGIVNVRAQLLTPDASVSV
jgi:mannose PTS system EIIA component